MKIAHCLLIITIATNLLLINAQTQMSASDKQMLLDLHNKERRSVQPEAANMKKMHWAEDLEKQAEKWAKRCIFEHSTGTGLGENLAARTGSHLKTLVDLWTNEKKDYTYPNTCNTGKVCGHYTQEVWWNSNELGCHKHLCPAGTIFPIKAYFLVCNYRRPGNFIGQPPYISGKKCSKCDPGEDCDDGLCIKLGNNTVPTNVMPTMPVITAMPVTTAMPSTVNVDLTQEEIKKIVDLHNGERRGVMPRAKNMKKMVWNDELAKVAKEWAQKCKYGHSESPMYGENSVAVAGSKVSIETMISVWSKEKNYYSFPRNCKHGKDCSHYTQQIWWSSSQIGCYVAICPAGTVYPTMESKYLVCNYYKPGNDYSASPPVPYLPGRPCSKCDEGESCENGLCATKEKPMPKTTTTSAPVPKTTPATKPEQIKTDLIISKGYRVGLEAYMSKQKFPWVKAVYFCKKLDMTLFTPKSYEKLLWLGRYVWVNAKKGLNGKWVDSNGVDVTKGLEGKWAKGQPDDWEANEDCVMARPNGYYNDLQCKRSLRALCVKMREN